MPMTRQDYSQESPSASSILELELAGVVRYCTTR